ISLHPMRFKIIQTDDYVYQLWEYNQNWRQIALNVPQDPDPAITWYGNAVGKWEGDTLVVDSIGYKDSTWLDARGLPHTQDLHLVERIHRMGENLAFDITFEDPGAFTKPWTAHLIYKPSPDGTMSENIYTISDELRFRERFLNQKVNIPIRRQSHETDARCGRVRCGPPVERADGASRQRGVRSRGAADTDWNGAGGVMGRRTVPCACRC